MAENPSITAVIAQIEALIPESYEHRNNILNTCKWIRSDMWYAPPEEFEERTRRNFLFLERCLNDCLPAPSTDPDHWTRRIMVAFGGGQGEEQGGGNDNEA